MFWKIIDLYKCVSLYNHKTLAFLVSLLSICNWVPNSRWTKIIPPQVSWPCLAVFFTSTLKRPKQCFFRAKFAYTHALIVGAIWRRVSNCPSLVKHWLCRDTVCCKSKMQKVPHADSLVHFIFALVPTSLIWNPYISWGPKVPPPHLFLQGDRRTARGQKTLPTWLSFIECMIGWIILKIGSIFYL